jgi:hypothetical protein
MADLKRVVSNVADAMNVLANIAAWLTIDASAGA